MNQAAGRGPGAGPALRAARQARGYSQQQLAGMAGVSRQAAAAVEAGHSDPSLRVALALARALGVAGGRGGGGGGGAGGGAGRGGPPGRRGGGGGGPPALRLFELPRALLAPPVAFTWWPCSSGEALRLAAAGLVHAAGAHLRGHS